MNSDINANEEIDKFNYSLGGQNKYRQAKIKVTRFTELSYPPKLLNILLFTEVNDEVEEIDSMEIEIEQDVTDLENDDGQDNKTMVGGGGKKKQKKQKEKTKEDENAEMKKLRQ